MCRGSVHNRSQMTSKSGKNNEVPHEPQASVTLMFLPHFDVLCDLSLNTPTVTWNLFILCNVRKDKRPIHIPASYRMVPSATFRPSFFFFLYLNCIQFLRKVFFNVFPCSKQNNGENILRNGESLIAMKHHGSCCEDLL